MRKPDKRNTSCHLPDYTQVTLAIRAAAAVCIYQSGRKWKESRTAKEKRARKALANSTSLNENELA